MTNKLTILLISSLSLLIPSSALAELPKWQHYQLPIKSELRGSDATDKTLWVVGDKNAVFISKDHGTSWQDISPKMKIKANDGKTLAYNFRDIEVFNETTAMVMSVGSGAESTLQITRDQGKTWQVLRTNKEAKGFYDSIGFWDENNGVMIGDPINGHFVIELTKDQGKTWQRISIDKLPVITEKEAAFAASGNTLIVGDMGEIWLATGGLSASVYHSTDFGQTWTKSSVSLENTTETSGGYALGLNSQQQVFALGGNYLKRDGHYNNVVTRVNNHWQVVENGGHGLRTAMSCVKSTCISTGKLSSDISTDHGKSWQVFSNHGFYTLASNNKSILAAGSAGKVAVLMISD
ncbi:MAG: oxidoreductase [Colwellia sp.]|nr:oxidoreductase [Colwellia sp.]